jgi:hypothetical protein
MASSFTTNKILEKPGNGDYVDTWNVPVNGDLDIIDQAFGGVTALNATGGSATLTDTQYRSLILSITGAISANVTYTIPSGKGGQWIVRNSTTDSSGGPWTITIASGGGGTSLAIPRTGVTTIFSDGTNIRSAPIGGAAGQVTYNSGGAFAGSANMTFDGTTLTANTIVSQTTSSDVAGNLRSVPANSQTASYTLVVGDNGKYISITTGGVIVPPSIFSVGQVVSVYNNSGSSQTITGGTGVTLRLVGTTTTGNRTLSNYGLATILCVASNVFVVTGGGVS